MTSDQIDVTNGDMPKLPVFLCYRQADGHEAARQVYELLNGSTVDSIALGKNEVEPHQLDVYYDQTSAAQDDWTTIHEPYLKRARAMVLVCTPGSFINEGPDDWVYKELNWWLESGRSSPILIDALGSELRYVPKPIAERWPNAQRIKLVSDEWELLPSEELAREKERVKERILSGIAEESHQWLKLELETQRKLARTLRTRYRVAVAAMALALLLGGVAIAMSMFAQNSLNKVNVLIQRIDFGNKNADGIASMQRICDEAVATTMALSVPTASSTDDSRLEERFWQLYYGEMNLIELREMNKNGNKSEIDYSMKAFGDALKAHTDTEVSSTLKSSANRLECACKNFISQLL